MITGKSGSKVSLMVPCISPTTDGLYVSFSAELLSLLSTIRQLPLKKIGTCSIYIVLRKQSIL